MVFRLGWTLSTPEGCWGSGLAAWPELGAGCGLPEAWRSEGWEGAPPALPPLQQGMPLPLTPRNWAKQLCIYPALVELLVTCILHSKTSGSPWDEPSPWSSPPRKGFPFGSGSELRTHGPTVV